jgi:uncharacterized membrane protein
MKNKKSILQTKNLTLLSLMTALVAVFQCIGLIIPIGFNVGAFALVPIVVGAAMLGPIAGAWLGFVFGFVVVVTGQASGFYVLGVVETIAVVLIKGIVAGLCAALVYKLIAKKNSLAAIITASVVCPVVNTAIFTLACYTVFFPGISEWASGAGKSMLAFIFLTLIGANFFVELGICVIFSSVADRIIRIGNKMRRDKSYI